VRRGAFRRETRSRFERRTPEVVQTKGRAGPGLRPPPSPPFQGEESAVGAKAAAPLARGKMGGGLQRDFRARTLLTLPGIKGGGLWRMRLPTRALGADRRGWRQ
jgi:hypothetical protein